MFMTTVLFMGWCWSSKSSPWLSLVSWDDDIPNWYGTIKPCSKPTSAIYFPTYINVVLKLLYIYLLGTNYSFKWPRFSTSPVITNHCAPRRAAQLQGGTARQFRQSRLDVWGAVYMSYDDMCVYIVMVMVMVMAIVLVVIVMVMIMVIYIILYNIYIMD